MTVKEIVKAGTEKVVEGDVVLTFGRSETIEKIFLMSHSLHKKFTVVVVDSMPKHEGKELLYVLDNVGITCKFISLNSISYIMKDVTKVMVGCHSMLWNGCAFCRAGSAMIALIARSYNVPFIVCCETYKFSDRYQLDSLAKNELGSTEMLLKESSALKELAAKWKTSSNPLFTAYNLSYDLTPSENIDLVITEVGLLPPTSVAVVIREYFKES